MHPVFNDICAELDLLITSMKSVLPQDSAFSLAHNNWSFPGMDGGELTEHVQEALDDIRSRGGDVILEHEVRVQTYASRLRFLREQTLPNIWSNAGVGVTSFLYTIAGLRKAVEPSLRTADVVIGAELVQARRAATRVRSIEASLSALEPRSARLEVMVSRIESAHDAADQLPADLESLREAKNALSIAVVAAEKESGLAELAHVRAINVETSLLEKSKEATAVLEKCEAAYSAATSQGLAAAFSERSNNLERSIWFWVAGLVLALSLGGGLGYHNLSRLIELVKNPNLSSGILWINTSVSILSIAAPVWFAWISTKQIGQRFRLAEDYAFKASVSRAYEGYRKEAHRIDPLLEARLLSSALERLDEQPLRLVEASTHGSPWHELIESDLVKEASKIIPGFTKEVVKSARMALRTEQEKQENEVGKDVESSKNFAQL